MYLCVVGALRTEETQNKNMKISSFKSSENIQNKEGGPDRSLLVIYDKRGWRSWVSCKNDIKVIILNNLFYIKSFVVDIH